MKAYTLIEMVVVIIIIWLILSIVWLFSWRYIYSLNVKNDVETLMWAFTYVQTSSLSQPNVGSWDEVFDFVWVKIENTKWYIQLIWFTWEYEDISTANIHIFKTYPLNVTAFGSWVKVLKGTHTILSWEVYFLYEPYKLNQAIVVKDNSMNWHTFTWINNDYTVFDIMHKRDDINPAWCFNFNFSNWRVYEYMCN